MDGETNGNYIRQRVYIENDGASSTACDEPRS